MVAKKNNNHKVDLKNPQLSILIEIIRSICCISVVPEFHSLKKYNLLELAVQNNNTNNNRAKEKCDELKSGEEEEEATTNCREENISNAQEINT